jgi:hypothetical protein
MRKLYTIILTVAFVIFITPAAFAQVANAGFENWTNGSPDGWDALTNINMPGILVAINITRVTDAHTGTYALRGDVINSSGAYDPVLFSGQNGGGTSYTGRDAAFTGYYKFVPSASGDKFEIDVITFKNGWTTGIIGSGIIDITASATSYTKFSVPITYISSSTPDSVLVMFTISGGSSGNGTVGSYFIIDDLAFGAGTGVEERGNNQPFVFSLNQNYPNPFNPSTIISYQVPSDGMVSLKVYDLVGREVSTLVNGVKSAGNYTATFNAANLPSGVYFYKLQAGNYTATKKAILVR